jgi:recombination protein RecA
MLAAGNNLVPHECGHGTLKRAPEWATLTQPRDSAKVEYGRKKSEYAMPATGLRNPVLPLFSKGLTLPEKTPPEYLPSGIPEVDRHLGGIPRGAVSEIYGPASSGRTSLLVSLLSAATRNEETCALVDADDTFDPAASACAGVDLSRLIWIRCGGSVEHALKAADLLIEGGGFGLVGMDLGDAPPREARRISLASWFRFRLAVEHTPTALIVVGRESYVSCAALKLEMRRQGVDWSGAPGCSQLLRGVRWQMERRKPVRPVMAAFDVRAAG